MFEAGALAKSLDKSRVVPFLLDVEPADLSGPLSQFQAARFEKSEVKRLVKLINKELDDRQSLEDAVLESVFQKWWPDLDAKVTAVLQKPDASDVNLKRSDREVLEEILDLVRDLSFRRVESTVDALTGRIESLGLAKQTRHCLRSAGIRLVGDLVQRTERELLSLPTLGPRPLNEIKVALAELGLSLGMRLEGWPPTPRS